MTVFLLIILVLLIFSFIKNYLHFINILIIFECFILIIFFILNFYQELSYLILFCVFSVCESSLGLTLIIIIVRCNRNDFCSLKFLSY